MRQALRKYEGRPEEQQLVLMNAQLKLQRGDVDGAIKALEAVQPGQSMKSTPKPQPTKLNFSILQTSPTIAWLA